MRVKRVKIRLFAVAVSCCLSLGAFASPAIEEIYQGINEEYVSREKIQAWLAQFDSEDQEIAALYLSKFRYYHYPMLIQDLRLLHERVREQLARDHFNQDGTFADVDFTKLYCAKSGDLISYLYRTTNKIRAMNFKNISDLNNETESKSDKALLVLEDYTAKGTRFLVESYAKRNHKLFNRYSKVYFVSLVANEVVIQRFKDIESGKMNLVKDQIREMGAILNYSPEELDRNIENLDNINADKLNLVYLREETSILGDKSPLSSLEKEKVLRLLSKYETANFNNDAYTVLGNTAFFFTVPDNLPSIFWNVKLKHPNGQAWMPLFIRTDDISICDNAKSTPINLQVL